MRTRMYCIVNQYISGIHAGIQSAHAIAELMAYHAYAGNVNQKVLTSQWAELDKTIIVLDGGYQSNLQRIYELACDVDSLPCAKFHEEEAALNRALTAVAIILPQYMYSPQYADHMFLTNTSLMGAPQIAHQYKDLETGEVLHNYTKSEQILIEAIKQLRLKGA